MDQLLGIDPIDVLIDAIRDTAVLVPFLFVTYLALEALEHAAGEQMDALVRRAGAAGPLVGAILGVVPQCGFSAMGATLYAGRVVTLGTLVAVFLSTSDEMLPLLVAERTDASLLLRILGGKALIALVTGMVVDLALRWLRSHPHAHAAVRRGVMGAPVTHPTLVEELAEAGSGAERIHELCERAHCGCDDEEDEDAGAHDSEDHGDHHHEHAHGHSHDHHASHGLIRTVLHGAIVHTVQVTVFIFLVTLVLTAVLDSVGEPALATALSSNDVLATFASGLVGLVPNCAASVIVTQLYLEGALATGPMMAGSLVAVGVGFLVLFRTNRSLRENVAILALLYVIGVVWGLLIGCLGI